MPINDPEDSVLQGNPTQTAPRNEDLAVGSNFNDDCNCPFGKQEVNHGDNSKALGYPDNADIVGGHISG